ncbi:capsular biosynthesis protein, partial [Burkholderia sp. SIMBA_013]
SILAGRAPAGDSRAVPGFPTLGVLDAGPQPPNPAELLREPALDRLLAAYADQYEIFIVNTPAATHSSDAQSIARQVDACVLVARKDVTSLSALTRTAEVLETAGVRVLGTVYNEYEPDAP